MSAPEIAHLPSAIEEASDAAEEALRWLSARAIELVGFPPERDLYAFICSHLKQLVGNAIVSVNSIDAETNLLRVRQLAGVEHTLLCRAEDMLKRKIVGATFPGVSDEAKRELATGSLVRIEGGLYRAFFERVPRPVCLALERLLGIQSIHSIGLRRKDRVLGNVTIHALPGARLNKCVIEAFVNQASAALERQLAECQARQASQNLETIAENVTDFVWMVAFEGVEEITPEVLAEQGLDVEALLDRWRFTFASPSAERVVGYHPEEILQIRLRDLLTQGAWDAVCRRSNEELAAGLADSGYSQPPEPIEVEHLGGDGRPRWCEVTVRFLRNDQGAIVGLLGVTRDIDQRRQQTEAIRAERDRLGQLLDMLERDRQLTAYEIHDGVIQPLAAALMHLESHLRQLDVPEPAAGGEGAEAVKDLLGKALGEGRRLMDGLRPPALDDFGVVSAVEKLIADHQRDGNPPITLTHDVRFIRLAPPLEVAVFRIVQEGLTNALRHAAAESIAVRLVEQDGQLTVEISDGGIGFSPSNTRCGGLGLEGIRRRAYLFNGRARVESRQGRGTRVRVVLPLMHYPGKDE